MWPCFCTLLNFVSSASDHRFSTRSIYSMHVCEPWSTFLCSQLCSLKWNGCDISLSSITMRKAVFPSGRNASVIRKRNCRRFHGLYKIAHLLLYLSRNFIFVENGTTIWSFSNLCPVYVVGSFYRFCSVYCWKYKNLWVVCWNLPCSVQ